ncbi:hypothetical protein BH09ACT8_BH09ACT8_14330 [soil metagenome]
MAPSATWPARTTAEPIKPVIDAAAADAGRPAPAIVSIPAAVTGDLERAGVAAGEALNFCDQFPSYRKVLSREALQHAAELAILGDESHVLEQVARYRDAGATRSFSAPFSQNLMR